MTRMIGAVAWDLKSCDVFSGLCPRGPGSLDWNGHHAGSTIQNVIQRDESQERGQDQNDGHIDSSFRHTVGQEWRQKPRNFASIFEVFSDRYKCLIPGPRQGALEIQHGPVAECYELFLLVPVTSAAVESNGYVELLNIGAVRCLPPDKNAVG